MHDSIGFFRMLFILLHTIGYIFRVQMRDNFVANLSPFTACVVFPINTIFLYVCIDRSDRQWCIVTECGFIYSFRHVTLFCVGLDVQLWGNIQRYSRNGLLRGPFPRPLGVGGISKTNRQMFRHTAGPAEPPGTPGTSPRCFLSIYLVNYAELSKMSPVIFERMK